MVETECTKLVKNRVARAAYLGFGTLALGFGLVGVVVPGLPTTVFLLIALWAFGKSCPRLESWLLEHPRFGPTLRDWQEHRSIRKRTKVVAVATIWVFIPISLLTIPLLWVKVSVLALGLIGTVYLCTRPTKEESPMEPALKRAS